MLDAAHEAQGAIWQLGRLTLEPFDQHRYDIRRGAAIDAVRAMRRAAGAVQLEGPADVAQAAEEYAKAIDRNIEPPIEALMQLNKGPLSEDQQERYRSTASESNAFVEGCQQRFVPLARQALDELMNDVD
ncbi:hypothetical protein [Streptomyces sp. NPDC005969]|uniref:hypothetical protein n=1 Tax=Streptomyces sp. NPDC005969 TaxID=3156722 RepID=UPI0033E2F0AB